MVASAESLSVPVTQASTASSSLFDRSSTNPCNIQEPDIRIDSSSR